MREVREFVRLQVEKPVKYRVLKSSAIIPSESRDISAGGIRFDTNELLKAGSVLEMELFLYEDIPPVSCMGEVIWSKEIKEKPKKKYETGVKFTAITPQDRQRVYEYVHKEIMRKRRGEE